MLLYPLCNDPLQTKTTAGWICACGETIPFGLEKDDDENCARCTVMNCPRRN